MLVMGQGGRVHRANDPYLSAMALTPPPGASDREADPREATKQRADGL